MPDQPIISRQFRDRVNPGQWLILEFIRLLPLTWTIRFLKGLGWAAHHLQFRQKRALIGMFQSRADGAGDPSKLAEEWTIHDTLFYYLGFVLMRYDAGRHATLIEVRGWEHVQKARAEGKGAVLLSSHVGFHRLLRWYLRSRDPEVYYLLRIGDQPPNTRSLRRRLHRKLRYRFGLDDDHMGGHENLEIQYLKKAYDHLRRNRLVNIAGDGLAGHRRLKAMIRGKELHFSIGGIMLGLTSGAPIIPCFCALEPGPRFQIRFQAPLQSPGDPPKSDKISALLRDYASRLETFIIEHPTQVMTRRYL